ncbi:MAG TPA: GNAT family N-acetyltransferase [Pseudonocardiaceae bacterium]
MGIRRATLYDVADIVALLADDPLGSQRERPDDLAPYWQAFQAIDADPDQLLVVVELRGDIVGTLQLTIIPGLSHQGATRGQIEGVRVRPDARGSGLGSAMILWAVDEARRRGCRIVQLTSHLSRGDVRRFYERLGFTHTHAGFKLSL